MRSHFSVLVIQTLIEVSFPYICRDSRSQGDAWMALVKWLSRCPSLIARALSLGPPRWKDRTDSCKLSSDLFMGAMVCVVSLNKQRVHGLFRVHRDIGSSHKGKLAPSPTKAISVMSPSQTYDSCGHSGITPQLFLEKPISASVLGQNTHGI